MLAKNLKDLIMHSSRTVARLYIAAYKFHNMAFVGKFLSGYPLIDGAYR